MSTHEGEVDQMIEGRPWWKVCLIIGGVFLLVVLVASFVFVRFYATGGVKRITKLPDQFPAQFVVYRPELVSEMYYQSAASKRKPLQLAMVPVKALSSLIGQGSALPDLVQRGTETMQRSDTVSISWTNVRDRSDEVVRFFAGAMKQVGVAEPQIRETDDKSVRELVGQTDAIRANVLIIDEPNTDVIDSITLIIDYSVSTE